MAIPILIKAFFGYLLRAVIHIKNGEVKYTQMLFCFPRFYVNAIKYLTDAVNSEWQDYGKMNEEVFG